MNSWDTASDNDALRRFELDVWTDAGLKRGYTTGSCATAAVKAALLTLLCNESPTMVNVSLPDGLHFLTIPIDWVTREPGNVVHAEVIKDGGADPDQTHRGRIFGKVRRNERGVIVFQRGEGVGIVTQPGLQAAIGEPAINPVPRLMMISAVHEVLEESDRRIDPGFDLMIGCRNGEQIAKRTFNPRLGIEVGISILGTTGIVEPKSKAAFQAISKLGSEFGLSVDGLEVLGRCKSIEEAIELIPPAVLSRSFWTMVEQRIAAVTAQLLPRVERVEVRLFRMDGESLSRELQAA